MIKVVMFDWGNTLMEELSGFPGPMHIWGTVQATPGIHEVLTALRGKYNLVVATNAVESNAIMVQKALKRVDLDEYFDRIYTARDLGWTKSDPQYYRTIFDDQSIAPEQALMTGDALFADVEVPSRLGARTIWLRRSTEKLHQLPMMDGEITSLANWLPAFSMIEDEEIPSAAQLEELFHEYPPSNKLTRHVRMVAATAYLMAQALVDHGVDVSPIVVQRAGLLHDIDKRVWRDSGLLHGEKGAQILEGRRLHIIAEIVRRHQVFTILDPGRIPTTWEQKLVYLADKYIEKDQFVGISARFAHFMERYPESSDLLDAALPLAEQMETEMLLHLGQGRDLFYAGLKSRLRWLADLT